MFQEIVMFQEIAPGIQLVGRFGIIETGVWLLHYGKEVILLEMPGLLVRKGRIPFKEIREFLTENQLRLKFLTATHNHADHFASIKFFHDNLPETPILVHKSFFHDKPVSVIYNEDQINQGQLVTPSIMKFSVPVYCFDTEILRITLDGESLFFIYAPKHSISDVMIIFRGCMISGDWWLGPGDPNIGRISSDLIQASITRLQTFVQKSNYVIHSVFSVHANEFHRNINFFDLMESTRPSISSKR